MSIEHFEPQESRHDLRNIYANTFLACRFCNRARGRRPTVSGQASLLNPVSAAWGAHFSLRESLLRPKAGDPDGEYTAATYDLNDPRKVMLRREHARAVSEAIYAFYEGPGILESLTDALERSTSENERRRYLDAFRLVQIAIQDAKRQLERFDAVPNDADPSCRCSLDPRLASHIANQCVDIDLGVEGSDPQS